MKNFGLMVVVHARATAPAPGPDLDDQADVITSELMKLEDATLKDTTVSITMDPDRLSAILEIELSVVANDVSDAIKRALDCIRCAIHAAGGGTPEWDTAKAEPHTFTAELTEVRPELQSA